MSKNKRKIKKRNYSTGTGYGSAGASTQKKSLKGFKARSTSPNEDIQYNLSNLRPRSRMLYMSEPIATSALKTIRTNVVGLGLVPSSKIDYDFLGISKESAAQTQKLINRYFDLWANKKLNCDARKVNNFYEMQDITLLGALMNGDAFALIKRKSANATNPFTLRIDMLEADLISTPSGTMTTSICTDGQNPDNKNKIYDGVEVDEDNAITAYHICNRYPYESGKFLDGTKWIRVPAYGDLSGTPNILHICKNERAGQLRGVPILSQVIEPLLQMRRYTESELMAALVNSFFTAFITTEKESRILEDEEGTDDINSNEDDLVIGTGQINQLQPGESITFGDPKHPNSGFDTFMITLCKLVASALELPHEVVLKTFNSNYSASRAAIMEAWKVFKAYRRWFRDDFCQPIYELLIDELVATGKISAPGYFDNPLVKQAYCGCNWVGPTQGQLDPLKEVTAEELKCEYGFSTREESTMNLTGGDFERNVKQLEVEEQQLATVKRISNITINYSKDD